MYVGVQSTLFYFDFVFIKHKFQYEVIEIKIVFPKIHIPANCR